MPIGLGRRWPALTALLVQAFVLLSVPWLLRVLHAPLSAPAAALLCGALAAVLSWWAGLRRWWLPLQLLFAPALLLAARYEVDYRFYLGALLLLALIFGAVFRTQVPLYLSGRRVWEALSLELPAPAAGTRFSFVDLGCGVGGVLRYLAARHPEGDFQGVELAPLPALIAWLRVRLARLPNCRVRWGSLWSCDLAHCDIVFAFLSPVPMPALWLKARREMRPGSLFISSSFTVPGELPDREVAVEDLRHTRLLIWKMHGAGPGASSTRADERD
jgi:SAM-dependent methyltransferase